MTTHDLTHDTAANAITHAAQALREHTPLVHCLTNTVVQNVTANALLAAGAAPAMVEHPVEAREFAAIASGVLINVGTMSDQQLEAMPAAAEAASAAGVPWVLDPVAVGALSTRTQLCATLLELHPTVIRANASEIQALAGMGAGGRGVDSTDTADAAIEAALALNTRTGAVVAISGEHDLIVWAGNDGPRALRLTSGHALLTRVIGTGCALGALTAAYVGAARHAATEHPSSAPTPISSIDTDTIAAAVLAAHAHTGAAGRQAAQLTHNLGAFAVEWINHLDTLTAHDIASLVHVSDMHVGETTEDAQ